MRKKQFNIYTIDHPDFSLSEKRPVLTFLQNHTKTQETGFDMHYFLEIGIVLSGKMQRIYDNWQTVLEAGQLWFCGAWEPHGYKIVNTPCRNIIMVIWPEFLMSLECAEDSQFNWMAPFSLAPRHRPQILGDPKFAEFSRLVKKMEEYCRPGQAASPIWLRVWLMELFLLVGQHRRTALPGTKLPGAPNRISPALEMVFQSRQFISEENAARACGLSRNTFGRIFRILMGIGFAQFALRYRLSNAARILLSAQAPIKAVAGQWGFTDSSHLYRCFEQHYGCTPAEYRQKHRG